MARFNCITTAENLEASKERHSAIHDSDTSSAWELLKYSSDGSEPATAFGIYADFLEGAQEDDMRSTEQGNPFYWAETFDSETESEYPQYPTIDEYATSLVNELGPLVRLPDPPKP